MNRSLFQNWRPLGSMGPGLTKRVKTLSLNFGPQHPAAHGVLRLILQLNGEVAEKTDIHVGLLHRGSEKLIEDKAYLHAMPYFDRFDYVSMMVQEHAYCLAVESLLGTTNYGANFTLVRSLFDEITRILNHMLAISCHALDVGSMSSVFWAFEEREKIMELYERVCGARMHAAFYRPNEVNLKALSRGLLEDALDFGRNCLITLNEMHNILTYSKIWKQRLVNIGSYSLDTCLGYGLTGVMARSAGARRDLRLDRLDTYANYYHLHFRTYLGQNGDSYDRFLMRMNEMAESINIISQLVLRLTNKVSGRASLGPLGLVDYLCPGESSSRASKDSYSSMEQLIGHFKHWGEGATIKSNWTYRALEAPKGEFGVGLVSDGTNKPFKCKVRSSAYHHLQVLPALAKGHFIADLSALIGTVDIVFGEIDR